MNKNKMTLHLSTNERLMLGCIRNESGGNVGDGISRIVAKGVDWQEFIAQAKDHGIATQAYLYLKERGGKIPEQVHDVLRRTYLRNVAHNLRLWSVLREMQRLLQQVDIEVIPLKGVWLSWKLYNNIGFRRVSDLDILVRETDVIRVEKELIEIGYIPSRPLYPKEFILESLRHRVFVGTTPRYKGISLEIHWNFYFKFPRRYDMSPVFIWQSICDYTAT